MKMFNWIYSFHMPLFFVMSGMFFVSGKYGFGTFLHKRFKQLIVPCLILSVLVVGLTVLLLPEKDPINSLKRGFPGALWFLWALFLLEVVYFVIDKLVKSNKWILIAVSFIAAFFAKWLNVNDYGIASWNINTVIAAFPFYCLGNLISAKVKRQISKRKNPWLTIPFCLLLLLIPCCVVLYTGETIIMYENNIPSPILLYYAIASCGLLGIIILSKLVDNYCGTARGALAWVGKNTIPILAFHQTCLSVSSKYFVCEPHIMFKALQQLLVWSVCLLAIWFCNRYFRVAVGKN